MPPNSVCVKKNRVNTICKSAALLLLALAQAGCFIVSGILDLTLSDRPHMIGQAKKNTRNLAQLKLGMSRAEVIAIMGTPYSSEVYLDDEIKHEILSYVTEPTNFRKEIRQNHLTPVALKEDKVIGWGRRIFNKPENTDQ